MVEMDNVSARTGAQPMHEEVASLAGLAVTLMAFLRRHARVIGLATAVSVGLGLAYLTRATPIYTSAASLVLEARTNAFSQQKPIVADLAFDSAFIESQVEIIRAKSVVLDVIRKLRLAENREFIASTGGLLGDLGQAIGRRLNFAEPLSEFERTERALRTLQGRLGVKRVGLSFVIEISFRSADPQLAADVANALSAAYLAEQAQARVDAARRGTVWLRERLQELREQTISAEKAVVEFKTRNNIVNAGGRLINEQQLAEINTQFVTARGQTAEARARLDRIEAVLRLVATNQATVDAAATDSLKSENIVKLRTQYLELVNREADWSTRYGPDHAATLNVRNQVRDARASILDELKRIAESYRGDYDVARQREDSLKAQLADAISESDATNQAQVAARELESTAQAYRSLYDDFLHRHMETLQQLTFPLLEGRVVSPAARPLRISWPRASVVLLLAVVAGVFAGTVLGMSRDLKLSFRQIFGAIPLG